jgi:hypothetical protein
MIEITALNHSVGDFRYLIIFARLDDLAINFLQVTSQSALFSSHNYCTLSATNRNSPSAFDTSNRTDFLPSFFN